MPGNAKKITIGAATVSVAPWVSGGTGHSFVDYGVTGPVELAIKNDRAEVGNGEQICAPQRSVITAVAAEAKFTIAEGDLDKFQAMLCQPTANLTGTAPNKTLLIGDPAELYYALKLETKGEAGTNYTYATRTITLYRCAVEIGSAKVSKGENFGYEVTFKALYDASVATADKLLKTVDASGA